MIQSTLFKGIALTLFATGVVGFVAYRSGMIDDWFEKDASMQQSPNGSVITSSPVDSTAKNDSTEILEIMPSSKMMVLPEIEETEPDTPQVKYMMSGSKSTRLRREYMGAAGKLDTGRRRKYMMGSSKYTPVNQPNIYQSPNQNANKNYSTDTSNWRKYIIGGSKSVIISPTIQPHKDSTN